MTNRPLRFGAAALLVLAGRAFGQSGGCCPTHVMSHPDDEGAMISGCGKARMLMVRAQQGLPIHEEGGAGFATREAPGDTDLLTVDLDIEINPAVNNTISGSNVMRVRSKVAGLTQFTFMLRSQFVISSITVDGVAATVSAPPANSYARTVTLPRAYALDEEFDVRIVYSGTAVSRGFGSITFGTQNGQPIVSTLSEAYFAATWWPIKDGDVFQPGDNGDKSIGRISITAPSTLRSVANGVLEATETLSGGRTRYRWRTNYPTSTYLWAFSTTNYSTWTVPYNYPLPGGGTGTMPVEFNIYPASDNPTNRAAWERVIPMLAVFRDVYGEYPFIDEKYGIYQFPFGGGMEHQTNSGQGSFGEGLSAHELAHQWWGDDVTCKTWNEIWLNEGFASYSEAIWRERRPGSVGFDELRSFMNSSRPDPVNDSVYVYDASNMNRIFSGNYSYDKGAWVLHMLRGAIGDAAFFQTLRDYRAAKTGSAATTQDFRSFAEAASGRNLESFFDAWVYGIGAVSYATGFEPVTIDGERWVRVSLRQTQDLSWGDGGLFAMPVTLGLQTASATTNARVENTARTQHYLLPHPAGSDTVNGMLVDPQDWILQVGRVGEAYVPGPLKLVSASMTGDVVRLRFSDAVIASAGQFSIGGLGGAVGFTFAQPEASLVTLTLSGSLPGGTYTVGVDSTLGVSGGGVGRLLDGEVVANQLPSGDGIVGGSASWTFEVAGCDTIDFNNDGLFPDDADLVDFLSVLAGGPCGTGMCNDIDFNNDGLFPDDSDLTAFLAVLAGGAC